MYMVPVEDFSCDFHTLMPSYSPPTTSLLRPFGIGHSSGLAPNRPEYWYGYIRAPVLSYSKQ